MKSWTDIDEFSHGDIKEIWELSRFDWVVAWSTQVANGDQEKLDKLNNWIANWSNVIPISGSKLEMWPGDLNSCLTLCPKFNGSRARC